MNFKKVNVSDSKVALVNFDNVCEIHIRDKVGCDIYFNTMTTNDDQSYIQVIDSIEEIEAILNIN